MLSPSRASDRDLMLNIRQLECDLDQARGDILERDELLARSKAAIEALQQELTQACMQAKRQEEEKTYVRCQNAYYYTTRG